MGKENYKEKGITLIALVITIIILLILAGVTLTTALGQNGLFQRAKYAGENYKESESDEAEKLGEVEKEIDKIVDGDKTPEPPVPPSEEKIEIPKNVDNKPDDSQTVNLGDVIVNGKVLEHGWQYYYTDESEGKVYFIYSDYLEENAIPYVKGIMHSGIVVYGNVISGNREQLINYLTGASNWTSIANGVKKALKEKGIEVEVTAAGGPTAEQLESAYNERYGSNVEDKLTIIKDDSQQVKYKIGEESEEFSVYVRNEAILGNKVFFLGDTNDVWGYWLAARGGNDNNNDNNYKYVCTIRCIIGTFDNATFDHNKEGVRPVISIPKSAIKD